MFRQEVTLSLGRKLAPNSTGLTFYLHPLASTCIHLHLLASFRRPCVPIGYEVLRCGMLATYWLAFLTTRRARFDDDGCPEYLPNLSA